MNAFLKFSLLAAVGCGLSGSAFAGSLWNESTTNERGMFADKRARRVGDIVTIVVQENTVATNSVETKTAREAKAGVGTNPLLNLLNQFIAAIPATVLGKNRLTDELNKAGVPGANLWDPLESTCRHASLSIL